MDVDKKVQNSHLVYINFTGQESNKILLLIQPAVLLLQEPQAAHKVLQLAASFCSQNVHTVQWKGPCNVIVFKSAVDCLFVFCC